MGEGQRDDRSIVQREPARLQSFRPSPGRSTGHLPADVDAMRKAAADLPALGPKSVLLKGRHLTDAAAIFDRGKASEDLRLRRVPMSNTHGTGCALSAAIAALLGLSVRTVIREHSALAFA